MNDAGHEEVKANDAGLAVGVALLAAGEGSRMGGVPKCLVRMDGQPLIRRSLAALREFGAGLHTMCVVVVTGNYADAIEPQVEGAAQIVRNPAPERGQQSSVRLGLEALGREALAGHALDVLLVMLADQPLIGAADLRELVAAHAARPPGCRVTYPEVDGQRGNPVAFDPSLVAEVLAARGLGGRGGLRGWIDANPAAVHPYPTSNSHFVTDLDTRDDLDRLAQMTGLAVELPLA